MLRFLEQEAGGCGTLPWATERGSRRQGDCLSCLNKSRKRFYKVPSHSFSSAPKSELLSLSGWADFSPLHTSRAAFIAFVSVVSSIGD